MICNWGFQFVFWLLKICFLFFKSFTRCGYQISGVFPEKLVAGIWCEVLGVNVVQILVVYWYQISCWLFLVIFLVHFCLSSVQFPCSDVVFNFVDYFWKINCPKFYYYCFHVRFLITNLIILFMWSPSTICFLPIERTNCEHTSFKDLVFFLCWKVVHLISSHLLIVILCMHLCQPPRLSKTDSNLYSWLYHEKIFLGSLLIQLCQAACRP
jgi:hypothetical protein